MTPSPILTEPDLIARSIAGDREAFADIVRRYQSLVCAIAYNATGNLAQSEDLSQEIFVTAWKKLPDLREPGKLRPWLCGIARNLINNSLRASRRHPVQQIELDHLSEQAALSDPTPPEQAITKEEEAILWRSLERIPVTYREPLILYYRQQHSLEYVAEALELSEDAVKQRLSRGRKLLHEELLTFVEGALGRSNPGNGFATGVVAALPAIATSAKAAALGATAAKGSATAKAAGIMGVVGALLTPLLMFTGYWAKYKMSIEAAQSDLERNFIKGFYRRLMLCIFAFFTAFILLVCMGRKIIDTDPSLFTTLVILVAVLYTLASVALTIWSARMQSKIRRQRSTDPIAAVMPAPAREYRSRLKLLGFPLFHMRLDRGSVARNRPIVAWIAIGENAMGLLFAFGGSAIAPVAIGGCALGIVAFGGMSIGLFSIGGFSIGMWSFGGLALGWQAFGGCAVAWNAASGGIAVAHTNAIGQLAQAANSNNATAHSAIESNWFFRVGMFLNNHPLIFNAFWAVPLFFWWRIVRKKKVAQATRP